MNDKPIYSVDTELGYIKAMVGAVGDETAYDAVKRLMRNQRVLDNFLPDEIQKILVEFGYATPEKTYRDNPFLLISDMRAIFEKQRNLLQLRNSEILNLEGIIRSEENE